MATEMDISTILLGSHPATHNSARWLRHHLNIPAECTIFKEFEQYFDCSICVADRSDAWMEPDRVVFKNSTDLLAFVLRWS